MTALACAPRSPAAAKSRGKLVTEAIKNGLAAVTAATDEHDYYAYHLLVCDDMFDRSPKLVCVHCVPTMAADKEEKEATGLKWVRVEEVLEHGSAWGCSNEGGDCSVVARHADEMRGATSAVLREGRLRLQGSKSMNESEGKQWPKTQWLRDEAASCVRGLPTDVKGEEGARRLSADLAQCLSSCVNFRDEDLPNLAFSPLGHQRETWLQASQEVDRDST